MYDDGFYENYFVNHPNKKLYIFSTLNFLLKHNDLKTAAFFGCYDYTSNTEYVERLVVSDGYVDNSVSYENWDEFANDSLTVPMLKNILRDNDLKVSGRKQELIDRIRENKIPVDNFKTNHVKITQKGHDFLKEHDYIKFYSKFLKKFDFNEFNTFFENHKGNVNELLVDFLDEQIKFASENNDEDKLRYTIPFKYMIINFLIEK